MLRLELDALRPCQIFRPYLSGKSPGSTEMLNISENIAPNKTAPGAMRRGQLQEKNWSLNGEFCSVFAHVSEVEFFDAKTSSSWPSIVPLLITLFKRKDLNWHTRSSGCGFKGSPASKSGKVGCGTLMPSSEILMLPACKQILESKTRINQSNQDKPHETWVRNNIYWSYGWQMLANATRVHQVEMQIDHFRPTKNRRDNVWRCFFDGNLFPRSLLIDICGGEMWMCALCRDIGYLRWTPKSRFFDRPIRWRGQTKNFRKISTLFWGTQRVSTPNGTSSESDPISRSKVLSHSSGSLPHRHLGCE